MRPWGSPEEARGRALARAAGPPKDLLDSTAKMFDDVLGGEVMPQKYGHLANAEPFERRACLVCDTPDPSYSWTDYSGEGTCNTCGTPYQLKWGELRDGESYPRLNVKPEALPMLRRYYVETKALNGHGTFMLLRDYPEHAEGRRLFLEWWDVHKSEYPEFA